MACEPKTFQSFSNLEPGEYPVHRFTIVSTDYGTRVRVDFEKTYMFLPVRFVEMLKPEELEYLNKSPPMMIYGGKDRNNRDR